MKRTILSTFPRTFVAIVEQGSITAAADTLDIAKSAVSQSLKYLEEHIGVKLAVRTTRRLSLTPAGEHYYRRCKELLALSNKAKTEMEAFGAIPSGPMTLTVPHAMITPLIAPAISDLMLEFPALEPRIIADDRRLDLVANAIDVAITIGTLKDSALRARKIGTMRDILCLSRALTDISLAEPLKTSLAKIQSLPYIAHERENRSVIEFQLSGSKGEKPLQLSFKPTIFANTVEALLAFARQGLGVALLPDFAVHDDLASGKLIRMFPTYHLTENAVYAVHAYDNAPPKSVRVVTEAIRLKLRQMAHNA